MGTLSGWCRVKRWDRWFQRSNQGNALNHSAHNLQKERQQQQAEASNEQAWHPAPALSFGDQRDEERHKPQKQRDFYDHWARLYNACVGNYCGSLIQVLPPSRLDQLCEGAVTT